MKHKSEAQSDYLGLTLFNKLLMSLVLLCCLFLLGNKINQVLGGNPSSDAQTRMAADGKIEQIATAKQAGKTKALVLKNKLPVAEPIEVSLRPKKVDTMVPNDTKTGAEIIPENELIISDLDQGWAEADYLANLEGQQPELKVVDFLIRLKAQSSSETDINGALKTLYDDYPNRNLSEVVKWVQTAKQSPLGIEYEIAEKFRNNQDFEPAYQWYQVSASDRTSAEAYFQLGAAQLLGRGTETSYTKAKENLFQAMRGNQPDAAYLLGVIYLGGLGTEANNSHAYQLFQRAIEKGGRNGYAEAGRMRELGRGVELDQNRAIEIYQRGVQFSDRYCINRIGELTGQKPTTFFPRKMGLLGRSFSDRNPTNDKWLGLATQRLLPGDFLY